MILDKGVAEFYATQNTAEPGEEPNDTPVLIFSSWFGELEFTSTPRHQNGEQLNIAVDRKIRVLDSDQIIKGVTVLIGSDRYTVLTAWHGDDKDSGDRVADVSLQRVVYDGA